MLGRATAGPCRSKQDAESVGSARTDRLEKSGRAWKKMVVVGKKWILRDLPSPVVKRAGSQHLGIGHVK